MSHDEAVQLVKLLIRYWRTTAVPESKQRAVLTVDDLVQRYDISLVEINYDVLKL